MDDISIDNLIGDVVQNAPKKNLTKLHEQERNKRICAERKELFHAPNKKPERVTGEVVEIENIKEFKELFRTTCSAALEQFTSDNPELTKKHPYNWYKRLLIEIKHNTPKIDIHNIDKLVVVWEALGELLYSIGLYPTKEVFYIFIGAYEYQFKKLAELNPKYTDFLQKISIEANNALISELHNNPYNQTNKIFLAKVNGFVEQTAPKTVEVNHHIKQYDDIAGYRLEDSQH